jgi:hypothetical protein
VPNPAEVLADLFRGHGVDLTGLEEHERRQVLALLDDLQRDLVSQLSSIDPTDPSAVTYKQQRLFNLLKQSRETINGSYADITKQQSKDMRRLAELESLFANGAVNQALGFEWSDTQLTAEQLRAIASDVMIEGSPARDWWRGQRDDLKQRFEREIRMGMLQGESIDEMVRRIRGKSDGTFFTTTHPKTGKKTRVYNFQGGVMAKSTREATALTRTSVAAVAAEARFQSFVENADVVKGVQQISMMDGRTSEICLAYANKIFLFEESDLKRAGKTYRETQAGIAKKRREKRGGMTRFHPLQQLALQVAAGYPVMKGGEIGWHKLKEAWGKRGWEFPSLPSADIKLLPASSLGGQTIDATWTRLLDGPGDQSYPIVPWRAVRDEVMEGDYGEQLFWALLGVRMLEETGDISRGIRSGTSGGFRGWRPPISGTPLFVSNPGIRAVMKDSQADYVPFPFVITGRANIADLTKYDDFQAASNTAQSIKAAMIEEIVGSPHRSPEMIEELKFLKGLSKEEVLSLYLKDQGYTGAMIQRQGVTQNLTKHQNLVLVHFDDDTLRMLDGPSTQHREIYAHKAALPAISSPDEMDLYRSTYRDLAPVATDDRWWDGELRFQHVYDEESAYQEAAAIVQEAIRMEVLFPEPMIEKLVFTRPNLRLKQELSWLGWYHHDIPGEMGTININISNMEDVGGILQTMELSARTGWHPLASEFVQSLYTHEFAHAVHDQMVNGKYLSGALATKADAFNKWLRESRLIISAGDVSDYAKKDIDELFAESFETIFTVPREYWSEFVEEFYDRLNEIVDLDARFALMAEKVKEFPEIFGTFYPVGQRFFLSEMLTARKYSIDKPNYLHTAKRPDIDSLRGHEQFAGLTQNNLLVPSNLEAMTEALELIGELTEPHTRLVITNYGWEVIRGDQVLSEFGRGEMLWLMDFFKNRLPDARLPDSVASQTVYSGFKNTKEFLDALKINSVTHYNMVEKALDAYEDGLSEALDDDTFIEFLTGMKFSFNSTRPGTLNPAKAFERPGNNYLLYVDMPEGTPFLYKEAVEGTGNQHIFVGGSNHYVIRDVAKVTDDATGEVRTAIYLSRFDQPMPPKQSFDSGSGSAPKPSTPLYIDREGWRDYVEINGFHIRGDQVKINKAYEPLDEMLDIDMLERIYEGDVLPDTLLTSIYSLDEQFRFNNSASYLVGRGQDTSFAYGRGEFLRHFFGMSPNADLDDLYGARGTNKWFTETSAVKAVVDGDLKWIPEYDTPLRVIVHSDLEDPHVIPAGDFHLSGRMIFSRETEFEVTGIDFDGKYDVVHLKVVSQHDIEDLPKFRESEITDVLDESGEFRIVSGHPEQVHEWAVKYYSHPVDLDTRPGSRTLDSDDYDRTALTLYRQEGGDTAVNVPLRSGQVPAPDVQEIIDDLDREFAKPETQVLSSPLTLWRGVSRKHFLELFFPEGRPDIPIDGKLIGITYTDPGFPSTGLLKGHVLDQFTHKERILLQIQAPDGTPVIYMDTPGIGPNRMSEFEFLLNRDQAFEIIDVGMVGERELVVVRLLADNTVPLPNRPKNLLTLPPHQRNTLLQVETGAPVSFPDYSWHHLNYGLIHGRSNLAPFEVDQVVKLDEMLSKGGRLKGPLVIEKIYTPEMLIDRGYFTRVEEFDITMNNLDVWSEGFKDYGIIRGSALLKKGTVPPIDSGSHGIQYTFRINLPEKTPILLDTDGNVVVGRGHTVKPTSFDLEARIVYADLEVNHRELPSNITFDVEGRESGLAPGNFQIKVRDENGNQVGKLWISNLFEVKSESLYGPSKYRDYLYVKEAFIYDPEYQGIGLGKEMYRRGAIVASEKGWKGIFSDTDRSSMATNAWMSIPEAELQPDGFYILRPREFEKVPEKPTTSIEPAGKYVNLDLLDPKSGRVLVSEISEDFKDLPVEIEVDLGQGIEFFYDDDGSLSELALDLRFYSVEDPEFQIGRYILTGGLKPLDPDMLQDEIRDYGEGWLFSEDIRLMDDFQGSGIGRMMYRLGALIGHKYGMKGIVSSPHRSTAATHALRSLEEHEEVETGAILVHPHLGPVEIDFSQTTLNLAQWNAMGESQRGQILLQLGRSHPALQGIDLWESLERYQSMDYTHEQIKRALRTGKDAPEKGATFLHHLDLLTKTFGEDLNQDIFLYRGISDSRFGERLPKAPLGREGHSWFGGFGVHR